jgi:hypothetical protein
MPSQEDLVDELFKVLEKIDRNDVAFERVASYPYNINPKLLLFLDKFEQLLNIERPTRLQLQKRGKVLEQIAYLVFSSINGCTTKKSFQSAGPQYDLIVTGDNAKWKIFTEILYLDFKQRDILIEAKAKNERLPDKDFARLCSIMECNLTTTGLGIFFTLQGATGFPKNNQSRQKCVRDCLLRQVIFHARTKKYIVVLDKNDIFSLRKDGSLITLLTRKIREIQQLSGLETVAIENFVETDLPDHLKNI